MNRKIQVLALLLLTIFTPSSLLHNSYAQASKNRRIRRGTSKSTPPAKILSRSNSNTSNHDIGVEVVATKLGGVIILTNREKESVTIRKIVVNDEHDYAGNGNLLHSTRSWTTLPVDLSLGDTLRVPIYPYKKAIIYIDIQTDKGTFTYKVNK